MTEIITASGYSPFRRTGYSLNTEPNTSGQFAIRANETAPIYASIMMKPKTRNQVKVRVTRMRSYGGYDYTIVDDLSWLTLTTRYDREPIRTDKRHLFMEVKVKATDQLNGTIQDLSGVVHSVLPVYNGTSWNLDYTRNPAWVLAHILTGEINKRAIDVSRLDLDSLLEWAEHCDEVPTAPNPTYELPRYECNFVLDYKTTLSNLINLVTNAAGASLNMVNGKYGVLIDKKKTIPVQMFTNRNSWGFSCNKNFITLPHALKIRYVDGQSNWSVREEIAYADGYDANTATEFQELSTFACTNPEQALRFGKYMLAQAVLRQETVSIQTDFENLVCTRGDYVLLQQDVMKVGGTPARVKSVAGNRITIDGNFVDGGGSYGYTFRGVGGIETGTLTIVDSVTADLVGEYPSVGDLIVWGEVESITYDMVVKAINPGPDLTATLTLIELANAIHDAESAEDMPEYTPALTTSIGDYAPPSEVQNLSIDDNTWECFGGQYRYFLNITWDIPESGIVETYEIYVSFGTGYKLAGYASNTDFKYIIDEENLGKVHKVKVLAVSATGSKISLGNVTAVEETPESKATPPSDVDGLFINVTNESLQLDWPLVDDCDVEYYAIRYSPNVDGKWWSSIPLQEVGPTTNSVTVQARTGSYFVKAVDWNGNESANSAEAITSIPELVNLNIIEEINDAPDFEGKKDTVEKFGNTLVLKQSVSGGPGFVEYYPEGEYTFKDLLDLGEIYTVRLQASIEAEGFSTDDLMSNWASLSDVTSLASASSSDWSVETYYRSTDSFITMDTWGALSDVLTLNSGSTEVWTPWTKFTIGDFTGKIFQFKIKLISNKASVTPRILACTIKADMPDRIESYSNITVPVAGYNLTYDPAFAGPGTTPVIQVSQDSASQGDYYQLTNRTLEGVTIKFYDKNGVPVERQADIMIKGYGRKATSVL